MKVESGDIVMWVNPETDDRAVYLIGYDLALKRLRLIELSESYIMRDCPEGGRIFSQDLANEDWSEYVKLPITAQDLGLSIKRRVDKL